MINKFEKFVLRRLMHQSYPDKGSVQDEKNPNWYVVYLKTGNDSWLLHVKSMNDKGFVGNGWNEKNQGFTKLEDCIPFICTNDVSIEIIRQIDGRLFPLTYHSVYECVFYDWTRINRLPVMLGGVNQFFFKRKNIVLPERERVLRVLVERYCKDKDPHKVSHRTLPRLFYGPEYHLHSNKKQIEGRALLILESLRVSGELKREEAYYELSARALASLETYERESRRHRQIMCLTAALVAVGLIQVCVAWFTSTPRGMNDDSSQATINININSKKP